MKEINLDLLYTLLQIELILIVLLRFALFWEIITNWNLDTRLATLLFSE